MGVHSHPRRYARKVEIGRLIDAAKAHGVDVAGIRLSPDGTIEIVEARAIPQQPVDAFARAEAEGLI